VRDDKSGLASIGWMFSWFAMTTWVATLGRPDQAEYGTRLLARFQGDSSSMERLKAVVADKGRPSAIRNSGRPR